MWAAAFAAPKLQKEEPSLALCRSYFFTVYRVTCAFWRKVPREAERESRPTWSRVKFTSASVQTRIRQRDVTCMGSTSRLQSTSSAACFASSCIKRLSLRYKISLSVTLPVWHCILISWITRHVCRVPSTSLEPTGLRIALLINDWPRRQGCQETCKPWDGIRPCARAMFIILFQVVDPFWAASTIIYFRHCRRRRTGVRTSLRRLLASINSVVGLAVPSARFLPPAKIDIYL